MHLIFKTLLKNRLFPLLLLTILCGWLFVANYQPNTWLSGWDTLHPEFDLQLYFERIWGGVWQEHQGLGAVASQAHSAELTRFPLLWLLSVLLPLSLVRYGFFFLAWLAGVWGMYVFSVRILLLHENILVRRTASFLAALFYLLNLVMVQHAYVPLEMFAVHFALLPWFFWKMTDYLRSGSKNDLFFLGFIGFFSSSMAHTPTLFYVFLISTALYLVFYSLFSREKLIWFRSLIVGLVLMLANLFWIAPTIYFAVNHAHEVADSTIHRLFSSSAFLRSREYGNVTDLSSFKNFLFSWQLFNFESNAFVPMMGVWISHVESWMYRAYMIFIWGLSGLGLLISGRKKYLFVFSMFPVVLLGVFFWINQNPPFAQLYTWLRSNLPLWFGETLRFPFTKFSILMVFAIAALVSLGHASIMSFLNTYQQRKWFLALYTSLVLGLTLYSVWPGFQGDFISSSMRVTIPQNYFHMFTWFHERHDNGRVLKLPLRSYWGWDYYSWGYQGAGFTWFGIPQPTLDREFDRWNLLNETAYTQINLAWNRALQSHAQSEDVDVLQQLLRKYNITYLLLDESTLTPMENVDLDGFYKTSELLKAIGASRDFSEGFLSVYTLPELQHQSNVSVATGFEHIDADTDYMANDVIFSMQGNYFIDHNRASVITSPVIYPFTNFDERLIDGATLQSKENEIILSKQLVGTGEYTLNLPRLSSVVWPLAVRASKQNSSFLVRVSSYIPGVRVNDMLLVDAGHIEKTLVFEDADSIDYVFIGGTAFDVSKVGAAEALLGYVGVRDYESIQLQTAQRNEQIGQDVYTKLLDTKDIKFAKPSELYVSQNISLPARIEIIIPSLATNDLGMFNWQEPHNCDVFARGVVRTENKESSKMFYAHQEAVACNYIDYQKFQGFDSLFVRMVGDNTDGEGLRFFLRDYDSLSNNYEKLLFGSFNYSGVVFSATKKGQVLSIQTKSFGSIDSQNELRWVSVEPFVFDWISQIKLESTEGYEAFPANTLLVNDQAYEEGWLGYLGSTQLPLVQVNGWANGWLLPEGGDVADVRIIFWPQYLQWGGIILSLGTLLILGVSALVGKAKS